MAQTPDERAEWRRNNGLTRELQQERSILPHPARGGTRGYPVWSRLDAIDDRQNGMPVRSSLASHYRWLQQVIPYRMTGNTDRTAIVGVDALLLSIFLTIYPNSTHDEQAAFIYNEGGNLYDNSTITRRLKEMDVTRKIGSREAYQAFTPQNMLKVELFWSRQYPLGVVGTERRKFIDVDEFGMNLTQCNNKRGYSLSMFRIRSPGHYTRKASHSVFYAIEPGDPRLPAGVLGSIQHPRHWIRVLQNQGATEETYGQFIEDICSEIEDPHRHINNTDAERVFLWDNLHLHNSPRLFQIVEGRNYRHPQGLTRFRIIPRPPYQPKYGPIEYKICDVIQNVQLNSQRSWTDAEMEQAILNAAARVVNVDDAFAHCGYTHDGVY